MKTFLKITGVAMLIYAATLATQTHVRKAVAKEVDSLSFYYHMSPEEYKSMQEDREWERNNKKEGGKNND